MDKKNAFGKKARRAANRERAKPPLVTDPFSRHVHIMADTLWDGKEYHMFTEEPRHCAGSMYAVISELWRARHRIAELEAQITGIRGEDDGK